MAIQNNVRVRRTERGLSAPVLAEMVNISPKALYNVENMCASHVSFSLIQRLTTALKCASVRDLFPGTMCPEITQKDLRAHKRCRRNATGDYVEVIAEDDGVAEDKPLKVGDKVRVNDPSTHEHAYVGEVIESSDTLFVVRHPIGWKECFRWDDLDGCKVRKYVEGWKVGML